uniref:Uncharacterized protein n=1 Tax=Anguilla anguilla TaxID=7936 RepID=A0A0E9P6E9_ANGAN
MPNIIINYINVEDDRRP